MRIPPYIKCRSAFYPSARNHHPYPYVCVAEGGILVPSHAAPLLVISIWTRGIGVQEVASWYVLPIFSYILGHLTRDCLRAAILPSNLLVFFSRDNLQTKNESSSFYYSFFHQCSIFWPKENSRFRWIGSTWCQSDARFSSLGSFKFERSKTPHKRFWR